MAAFREKQSPKINPNCDLTAFARPSVAEAQQWPVLARAYA
jgi:hypothetical protein